VNGELERILEGSRRGLKAVLSGICLEELRKTTKNLS
jgi:hypothetical protein